MTSYTSFFRDLLLKGSLYVQSIPSGLSSLASGISSMSGSIASGVSSMPGIISSGISSTASTLGSMASTPVPYSYLTVGSILTASVFTSIYYNNIYKFVKNIDPRNLLKLPESEKNVSPDYVKFVLDDIFNNIPNSEVFDEPKISDEMLKKIK